MPVSKVERKKTESHEEEKKKAENKDKRKVSLLGEEFKIDKIPEESSCQSLKSSF